MNTVEKKIKLIERLIDSSVIPYREYIKNIDVKKLKDSDEVLVEVVFYHGVLDQIQREDVLNKIWEIVFNFTHMPVFVSMKNYESKKDLKENEDKSYKLLIKFVSSLSIEGVCGFWIDEEKDENDMYWVYLIIDKNWLDEYPTKPEFVVRRIRNGVKEEIKKFLGIDVQVGSLVKKC